MLHSYIYFLKKVTNVLLNLCLQNIWVISNMHFKNKYICFWVINIKSIVHTITLNIENDLILISYNNFFYFLNLSLRAGTDYKVIQQLCWGT